MTTPDSAYDFHQAARHTVLSAVRHEGGEITERPIPGMTLTTSRAEPLAGIKSARSLGYAAARVAGDYIRLAREDGMDWLAIGEALGLEPDDGDLATAAWEHAAGPRYRMDPLSFHWTCPACGQVVTDYGPQAGYPTDQQSGHADGCTRLAAEIAAHEARWEDGDG